MDRDIEYMRQALALAEQAANMGEVPVGALVVDNASGEVISSAYNLRETNKSATAHAEILAIEEACRQRGGWRRLSGWDGQNGQFPHGNRLRFWLRVSYGVLPCFSFYYITAD